MITGLLIILLLTLILPLLLKVVERNLEVFLLIMGLSAAIISGMLSRETMLNIFQNKFLYMIAAAVFAGGALFKSFNKQITKTVEVLINRISLRVFVFLMILVIGLVSSVITAIIASLLLVEITSALPVDRSNKISINIIACFSIGLGASLTPIGEPLSTVVISHLNVGFWYIVQHFGILILSGILVLALLGIVFAKREENPSEEESGLIVEEETYRAIIIRTIKVFIFVMALELLGGGYQVIIDTYLVHLDSHLLYWTNMLSAVLDNATLATAEISLKMSYMQIEAVLMGLLVSGGMMIPGNIPNIISAHKLNIKSSEWIKLGIPVGLVMLAGYYFAIF